jgi:hypothetical protein
MKLCHAVALALVGWYLVSPPIYKPGSRGHKAYYTDVSAPLSQWTIMKVFDSAADCQKEQEHKNQLGEMSTPDDDHTDPTGIGRAVDLAWKNEACIASDDPRLAK